MAEQKFIRIVNWGRFQHYKNRNPPWIKLHRELLTSRTWATSDDATRVLAIALMMLAAASDNKIPADLAYIRRVAYLNQDPDLSTLLATEFIEIVDGAGCASTSLADASKAQPIARPETETETETDPPPLKKSVFALKENARTREASERPNDFHMPSNRKGYDPEVGLAIDFRKLSDALNQLDQRRTPGSQKQIFEWACDLAGITVERGLEVQRLGKQWPTQVELETSA